MDTEKEYYFNCPSCGSNERFSMIRGQSSDVSGTIFLFGGLLATLFYSASKANIQCANCGYLFTKPPFPQTGLSKLFVLITLVATFVLTALGTLYVKPEYLDLVTLHPNLQIIDTFIAENSKLIVLTILPLIAFTAVYIPIAAIISTFTSNREIRRNYKTQPADYQDNK